MAGRCTRYITVWDPVTGREKRKCVSRARSRSKSELSGLGGFGSVSSLKASVASVKGVLITGGVAAGGAYSTARIFEKVGKPLNLEGYQRDLAEMGAGILLGIGIAKVLKKPKLGAAFAIGPVVVNLIKLFANVMGETPAMAGLGLTAFRDVSPYDNMYAPLGTTEFKSLPETAFRARPFAANNGAYAMPAM